MPDIRTASQALTRILGQRAKYHERTVLIAKIATAVGAFVMGVAKYEDWPALVVYVTASVVLIAAIFLLFSEIGGSASIAEARSAMDDALDENRKAEAAEKFYSRELDRLSHFLAARDLVRALLEQVLLSKTPPDEIAVIDLMLQQAKRQLLLAHGFAMEDFYTISIYQRLPNAATGTTELVCKASVRAIICDLSQARIWKEGVGVAGVALARGEEVIVPDLKSLELGSLYNLPMRKPEDDARYASMVSEPILDGNEKIWGILVVSSSVVGHFNVEDRGYADVAQSLAGMISLAIKVVRSKRAVGAASHI